MAARGAAWGWNRVWRVGTERGVVIAAAGAAAAAGGVTWCGVAEGGDVPAWAAASALSRAVTGECGTLHPRAEPGCPAWVGGLMLSAGLTEEQVLTSEAEVAPYGINLHSHFSSPPPDVVTLPSSTEQVSAIVRYCYVHGIPVVARGSGTGLEGHTCTPCRGVVVDLSRMDAVVEVRPRDMDCTVQAGVTWEGLNAHLAAMGTGLFLPVDPGPGASIGGMVGTRCSGTNAVKYGTMKNHVLSLTVVLPDGTVVETGSRARKSSAGYDVTSLFVGAEGTLGIVTHATLRLAAVPEETAVAACCFPTLTAATDAVLDIMRAGIPIAAVELLDARMVHAVNVQSGFDYPVKPHLFFKFAGITGSTAKDAARVAALTSPHGGGSFAWAGDAEGQARLWQARKVALWSVMAMDTSRRVMITDVCVPISRLSDMMTAVEAATAASPLQVHAVGHVGDGNVHHLILFDPNSPAEVAEGVRLNELFVLTALSMGGTCTGEHGVGSGKMKYLPLEFTPATLELMRRIKRTIDPRGIMNPGKKLPPAEAALVPGLTTGHHNGATSMAIRPSRELK